MVLFSSRLTRLRYALIQSKNLISRRSFQNTWKLNDCRDQKDSYNTEGKLDQSSQRNDPKLRLNDGNFIPQFGFGTWKLKQGSHTVNAVKWALKIGYRQIDTASSYSNEESVGTAVRESGIAREEVFVTTKLYDGQHGYDETLKAFNDSLSRLGLDYIDLYLIHSPKNGEIISTWKAMVELQQKQLVRSIGVSNFGIHHLAGLRKASSVPPSINQIEVHPYLQEKELVKYCTENNIAVQAYSPLVNGRKFDDEVLLKLGKKYNCKPAVILIKWSLQKGYVCIPKSGNADRIEGNITAFDFKLEQRDMDLLDCLEQNFRTCHEKIKLPWTG